MSARTSTRTLDPKQVATIPHHARITLHAREDGWFASVSGDTESLFGVPAASLAEAPVTDLFASAVREHLTRLLQRGGSASLDTRSLLQHPDGRNLPVSVRVQPQSEEESTVIALAEVDAVESAQGTCDLVTAAAELGRVENAQALVDSLARLTGAEVCFFGRRTDGPEFEIRTLAMTVDGAARDNMVYDLADTPCADVLKSKACIVFPSHVRECFPDCKLATELELNAFIGAPLRDASGRVTGMIATAYRRPLTGIAERSALVELFAQRAASQVEQLYTGAEVELYRSLLNHSHEGILVICPTSGEIVEANQAVAELLGYERGELYGLPLLKLDDRLRDEAHLKAWAQEESIVDDGLYRRKDGSLCAVETSVRKTTIAGRPYFAVGVRDVSARRHAEEALRESEQRFRALVENSSDVVTMLDADGRILYISPSIRHVFGLQPGDLLGESFFNRVVDSQRRDLEHCYQQWIQSPGDNWTKYFDWLDAGGGTRHVAARVCNLLEDSAVQAIVINMRDNTDRIRAMSQMRRQADLINHADEAICVWDLNGDVHSWNRGAEKLYGYTFPEVFGQPVHQIGLMDEDEFAEALDTVRRQGSWSRETSMIHKSGEEVHVYSRWSLLRDDQGNPEEILVIDGDISKQKRIENQLRRNQRMESIGTLASGITHDLNNILMPILMLATTLKRQASEQGEEIEDIEESLDMIIQSAKRGADIVKQVLTYVRGAEGSRILLQPQNLLKELVKLVKETFPKNLQLHQMNPSGAWMLQGNATELNQVLLNLAVNARDAMPEGGSLDLSLKEMAVDADFAEMNGAESGPYIVFRVADTGGGISPENVERIFDPFFTTKPTGEGTGLGLATVEGIVQSHGGFIDVKSRVGIGSEFRVYLPAIVDSASDSDETDADDVAQGRGQTILVVDDELSIQHTLRHMLERFGYNVIIAENGVEAISKYNQHRESIDLVITDITMPELNGIDFVKVIKNMDPEAKIIVSSGRLVDGVTNQFKELGVSDFLAKPYAAQELLAHLDRLLTS